MTGTGPKSNANIYLLFENMKQQVFEKVLPLESIMLGVQPVQNVHVHQVISLFRNLAADHCCGKP